MSGWPSTLSGVALLLILLGLAGFTASRVGSALVPPTADLWDRVGVAGVVGLIGWIVLLQVLGLLGALWLPVVVGCLTLLAALSIRFLPAPPRPRWPDLAMPRGLVAVAIPFAALAVVEAVLVTTLFGDIVHYHIVNAAHILDSGSIRTLPFAQPGEGSATAPGNGTLVLLAVMLPFHTAGPVPLASLFCAALLVAVTGMLMHELGRSAWVGAAAALVLASTWCFFETVVRNAYVDDILSLVGLVSAVTFGLRCARTGQHRWLLLAGLSVGLAVGSKGVDILPGLAVALAVVVANRVWREPAWFAVFVAAILAISLSWYVRNWVATGDPLYPEPLRLGSSAIFAGLTGSGYAATGVDQSLLSAVLGGRGTTASQWFNAVVPYYGLCLAVPLISLGLAVWARGRIRMLSLLAVACTALFMVTPFTGSVRPDQLAGSLRYFLPAVAFGVVALAAAAPPRQLVILAAAALATDAFLVCWYGLAHDELPVPVLLVACGLSVILLGVLRYHRALAMRLPSHATGWVAVAGAVAVAAFITVHDQPSQAPIAISRAVAAAGNPQAPVVVLRADDTAALLGPDLDVHLISAGEGPQGAQRPIWNAQALTRAIVALHPAAVAVGDSTNWNVIPPGWRPPSSWREIGTEAGTVVYEP
jgi:4-amino-4-deoxy-L-arabinose transferase-like glycosyltransferase